MRTAKQKQTSRPANGFQVHGYHFIQMMQLYEWMLEHRVKYTTAESNELGRKRGGEDGGGGEGALWRGRQKALANEDKRELNTAKQQRHHRQHQQRLRHQTLTRFLQKLCEEAIDIDTNDLILCAVE